jgi:hypothetical protein
MLSAFEPHILPAESLAQSAGALLPRHPKSRVHLLEIQVLPRKRIDEPMLSTLLINHITIEVSPAPPDPNVVEPNKR